MHCILLAMKTHPLTLPTIPVLLLMLTQFASGAVLTEYAFTGNSTAPTTLASNVTGGNFAASSTLTLSLSGTSGNPAPSIFINTGETNDPANDYLRFTLTAEEGYVFTLTSLSFDYVFTGTTANATVSGTYAVRSSIDGFVETLASYSMTRQVNAASFVTTSPVVDLSTSSFANLEAIEFRIYLSDNAGSNSYLRMDNVTLNGEVGVIPEPGSAALILGAGILFAGIRSHKKRRSKF